MKFLSLCILLGLSFSTLYGVTEKIEDKKPVAEEKKPKTVPQTVSDEVASPFDSFDKYVTSSMQSWNVPGLAIAIVKDNKTVYSKGFGVKKLGGKDKIDTQTLFQIGSLTKSFTSALIALMVDEGQLKWTDHVIDYYPEFILYDPWVTREFQVQDLLCDRSGLPAFAGDLQTYLGYNAQQIVHNLRYIKPVSSFRSAYAFQNSFYLVAAEVLKRVSGRSWEDLIHERIFFPLGMKSSSLNLEEFRANKNLVGRHAQIDKKMKILPENDPALKAIYTFAPAGGINSTIEDMSQWLKLQINQGVFNDTPLIGAENIKHMLRRYIYMGSLYESDNYACLGWAARDYSPYPIIWHDGGASGSSGVMAFIPEEKLGIVILSNTGETSLNYALAWEFFDLYYKKKGKSWSEDLLEQQLLSGEYEISKRPAKPTPPLNLEDYTGVYFNKMYGIAEVAKDKDDLVLTLGPDKVKLILKPWDRDTFELLWPQMNDIAKTKVFFTKDVNGFHTQMDVEMLNKNSDGSFKRLGEE